MEQSPGFSSLKRAQSVLTAVIALGLLLAFAAWSGVPRGDQATPFWIGVAILIAVLFGFGWATWHLLIRPLPAGHKIPDARPISATMRAGLALLLGVGGMSIIIGAFWDEVWHRTYGIPFGEDFLWRPHLLMYFGFASVAVLAIAGLRLIMRTGRGSFQQRFRANPIVGLLVLAGGFMLYVLPADPIWHSIYGEDITAWGIPHLLLMMSFFSINLLSVAIHRTTQPVNGWRFPLRLHGGDLLPLFNFTAIFLVGYQFFTTEWDSREVAALVAARPEWLLPALIAGVAVWIGLMVNHALRLPGAATLAGLTALIVRYALVQLFGAQEMMLLNGWWMGLFPLVALDLYYAAMSLTGRNPVWAGGAVSGFAGMLVGLFVLYPRFYPDYALENLPLALLAVLLGCLLTGWLGATLGEGMAQRGETAENVPARSRAPLAALVIFAACAVFVVVYVTTATPPV